MYIDWQHMVMARNPFLFPFSNTSIYTYTYTNTSTYIVQYMFIYIYFTFHGQRTSICKKIYPCFQRYPLPFPTLIDWASVPVPVGFYVQYSTGKSNIGTFTILLLLIASSSINKFFKKLQIPHHMICFFWLPRSVNLKYSPRSFTPPQYWC